MNDIGTPYDTILDAFFARIEKDRDFFMYLELDAEQAMAIAKERATYFLHEAAARIAVYGMPSVDFLDYDDTACAFGFELVRKEVYLMASLMYESYMHRDISVLKCLRVDYTPSELKVYSPSDARKTFQDLYGAVCAENTKLLEMYKDTDRITGEYLGINFSAFDED